MTTFHIPENGSSSTVASPRTAGATSLTLVDGSAFGADFPKIVTVSRSGATLCILEATARSGATLTISGAIEGTADVDMVVGDVVQLRPTKLAMTEVHAAINAAEASIAANDTAIATKADDDAVVHLSGDPIRDKGGQLYNVASYGAVGDGTTDDTAAIAAAWAASSSCGPLFIPPGYNCRYNGTGLSCLSGGSAVILGAGRNLSRVTLGASSRLFDTALEVDHFHMEGLWVEGGLGGFRSTFAGSNSSDNQFLIIDCVFSGYTACAVETNSPDWPWIRLVRNQFYGSSAQTSIGVALTGWLDGGAVADNSFWDNRVGLKLGVSGGQGPAPNFAVARNNFMRIRPPAGGVPRVDVWVVPNPSGYANAGTGLIFDGDRFGNESLAAGDYRVLVADEGAGATNAARFPVLDADSAGFFSGVAFRQSSVYNDANAIPWLYSTTPNLAANSFNIITNGIYPAYLVQFRTPPTTWDEHRTNLIGVISAAGQGTAFAAQPVSNAPGFGTLIDPAGLAADPGHPLVHAGAGDAASYAPLLTAPLSSYTLATGNSATPVADRTGGTDAVEVSFSGDGQLFHAIPHTSLVAGRPAYLEFDLCAGATAPLAAGFVRVIDGSFNNYLKTFVVPTAAWRRLRFAWTPQTAAADVFVSIENPASNGGATGTIRYGRIRAYHAQEPMNVDGLMPGDVVVPAGHTFRGDGSGLTNVGSGISPGSVTLADMADMATASLLGRDTAGSGSPEVLSASAVATLLGLESAAFAATTAFDAAGAAAAVTPASLGLVIAPVTHQFLTGIGTDGVPSLSQPIFADIGGSLTVGQLPTTGLTITSHSGAIVADTDAAAVTMDMGASDKHTLLTTSAVGSSRTVAFANVTVGQMFTVEIVQDATGSRLVSWPAGVRWVNGNVAPTLATGANKADLLVFYCRSSGSYAGSLSLPNY